MLLQVRRASDNLCQTRVFKGKSVQLPRLWGATPPMWRNPTYPAGSRSALMCAGQLQFQTSLSVHELSLSSWSVSLNCLLLGLIHLVLSSLSSLNVEIKGQNSLQWAFPTLLAPLGLPHAIILWLGELRSFTMPMRWRKKLSLRDIRGHTNPWWSWEGTRQSGCRTPGPAGLLSCDLYAKLTFLSFTMKCCCRQWCLFCCCCSRSIPRVVLKLRQAQHDHQLPDVQQREKPELLLRPRGEEPLRGALTGGPADKETPWPERSPGKGASRCKILILCVCITFSS